jgi:enterochelin esterase-like enzyme
MTREEVLHNQALYQHPLYYDPLNKKVVVSVENGEVSYTYVPEKRGVIILDYGKVEFNVYAPDAQKVSVSGWGGSLPQRYELNPLGDGYWQCVADDIACGFHYCDFFVNDVRIINSLAPVGYGKFQPANFFEMPWGEESAFYLLQDVPHGTVHTEFYHSTCTARTRICSVYTPPAYNTEKKYPVVYIQHGGGENETGWLWQGKINYICDNLIASGEMQEMIVVMNDGYAFLPIADNDPACGRIDEVLVQDCIPFIDSKYSTIADRHARAIAGLSMGGVQANAAVIRHYDSFASAGVFSGGFLEKGFGFDGTKLFANPAAFMEAIDMIFIAAGQQEQPMCDNLKRRVKEYRQKGLNMHFYSWPGYHEWDVWRHAAKHFMSMLFKNK